MPASDPKMSSTIEWWLTEERAHTKQRYRYFSKLVTSSLVQYSKTSPTWLQLQLGAIYLGQYFWLGIQSACTKKCLAWGKRGGVKVTSYRANTSPSFSINHRCFFPCFLSFPVDVCSCFLYKSAVKRLWCPGCTKARIYKRISNLRWWNDGLGACSNNPRQAGFDESKLALQTVFRPIFRKCHWLRPHLWLSLKKKPPCLKWLLCSHFSAHSLPLPMLPTAGVLGRLKSKLCTWHVQWRWTFITFYVIVLSLCGVSIKKSII